MNKRCISLLLLISLLLSACGASDSTETTDASADTTNAPETTVTVEYTAPDVDYGGETFTFLDMVQESNLVWNANSYSEIRADEENGEPLNDAQYKRNREVEALLNIKLETVPYGSKGDGTSTFRK